MVNALRALGAVWLLPATILVWSFELGPLLLLGWLRFDRWQRFLVARLSVTDKSEWYEKRWKGWRGSSRPHAIIIVNQNVGPMTVYEEELHTDQWFIFGVFFAPLWLLFNAVYGYDRNPLERWAKRYALEKATGQR